jgi:hypothetical protein
MVCQCIGRFVQVLLTKIVIIVETQNPPVFIVIEWAAKSA